MIHRRSRRSSIVSAAIALAACFAATIASGAWGQAQGVQKLTDKLNEPWLRVQEANRSWKPILTAFLDMTKPPAEIGPDFDIGSVWTGMDRWSEWSTWAEKNEAMGKALVAQQNALVFGMPYGEDAVGATFQSRGLYSKVVIDPNKSGVDCAYLNAIRQINAYAMCDMWRLGEAGKFDDAFKLGIAHLRMLRQLCDQQLVEETNFAMKSLADAFASHRDYMQAYLDKIPAELFQRLGTKDYPYLRPADGEKLRRIAMPEGDRYIAEAIMRQCFDENAQPIPDMFAKVFGNMQAQTSPMEAWGARKRWQAIAAMHGSLEASLKKLEDVYDDWWRRWRTRMYDAMLMVPTELSRLNQVRYSAVALSVRDLQESFILRKRLIAESNGTTMSAGLCGYKRGFGTWPDDIEKAYTNFFPKKFDFDPYDKDYGRFIYKNLGSKREIMSVWGRVYVDGAVLYARSDDHEDNGFKEHDPTGLAGDFVVWPAIRQLARASGASK